MSSLPPTHLPDPTARWIDVQLIRVYGRPKGQPRPRAFARRIGNQVVARVHEAGTAEGWKGCIAMAADPKLPQVPLAGPLRVDSTFLFHRPDRLNRRRDPDGRLPHTAKPDRDNLDKAVLDCLTQLGLWGDDAQVCCGEVAKFYVAKGERPGAIIRVMRWAEPGAADDAPATATATRRGSDGSRVVRDAQSPQKGSGGALVGSAAAAVSEG